MGKAKKAKAAGRSTAKGASGKAKRTPAAATAEAAKGNGSSEAAPRPTKIKNKRYESELFRLQVELVKMLEWIKHEGLKVVVIFEGRDAAGKGGVIKRITQHLSPRICRVVALPAPTEREQTQWYFQRYVPHLPAAGEMVLFDRSWYNRAGVERVMGFCTEDEHREFLRTCPEFERMLVRSGIKLIKYWFSVSDEEQERRFQSRLEQSHKRWKLSPMDLESRRRWATYSRAKDEMFRPHRHQAGALVRRRIGCEEARSAELHQPPAEHDPLRGPHAGADQASRTHRCRCICQAALFRPDAGPGGVPGRELGGAGSNRARSQPRGVPRGFVRFDSTVGSVPLGREGDSEPIRPRGLEKPRAGNHMPPARTDERIPLSGPSRTNGVQSGVQVRKPAKTSRRSGPKKFRYSPVTIRDRVIHAPPRSTLVWPNNVCEYSL